MGKRYMAIDLAPIVDRVKFIESEELNALLDIVAAAVDVEGSHPEGPSLCNLKNNILASEGFKGVRAFLESRL